MYKIPANTLFIGKNLVFVPDCHSTNTLALQLSQQPSAIDGTVVITDQQTAGKGQRGNSWEAEPGKNLTFSLILKPKFLSVNKQFYLNIVVCLALKDYLKDRTRDVIYIKWPNDILVHEKKISGVLIENQLQGAEILNAVVGIGLNINQVLFRTVGATSLSNVTKAVYDLNEELGILLGLIESRYLQLRQDKYELLMNAYLDALYRRGERHRFSDQNSVFEGTIRDLDTNGKLRIETEQNVRSFGVKEIKYI